MIGNPLFQHFVVYVHMGPWKGGVRSGFCWRGHGEVTKKSEVKGHRVRSRFYWRGHGEVTKKARSNVSKKIQCEVKKFSNK